MSKLKRAIQLFWLAMTASEYFYYFESKGKYYKEAHIEHWKIIAMQNEIVEDYQASVAVNDLKDEIGI